MSSASSLCLVDVVVFVVVVAIALNGNTCEVIMNNCIREHEASARRHVHRMCVCASCVCASCSFVDNGARLAPHVVVVVVPFDESTQFAQSSRHIQMLRRKSGCLPATTLSPAFSPFAPFTVLCFLCRSLAYGRPWSSICAHCWPETRLGTVDTYAQ